MSFGKLRHAKESRLHDVHPARFEAKLLSPWCGFVMVLVLRMAGGGTQLILVHD